MVKFSKIQKLSAVLGLCLGLICLVVAGHSLADNQSLTKGYSSSDSDLRLGMVVQLSENSNSDQPEVERASPEGVTRILGVATNPDDSLVVITSLKNDFYVQSSGEVSVFASDVNGQIKKGDQVSISPLKGIVMKATDSSVVLGTALEDFPDATATAYPTKSNDNGAPDTKVNLMKINLDYRPISGGTAQSNSPLAKVGRLLVGREVAEIRVLIALIIFVIVLIAEGSIIYGAVSSAITAIGRNPLANKIIRKELFRVLIITFFVLGIGLSAIYGILWV